MDKALEQEIRRRAGERCEYWLMPEARCYMKAHVTAAAMLVLCVVARTYADVTADFENYTEGWLTDEFTDPQSGFHFRSNHYPTNYFGIDYTLGDWGLPQVHGNYLV